jgi:Flp pilus assembly protein TadG
MREDSLNAQLRKTKQIMDRNAYILALLDGDGMIFNKELIGKGEKGGKEAATLLHAALSEYVTDSLGHLDAVRIVVRIYGDTSNLADMLLKCKEIDKVGTFQDFVRGFNSTKLLFDFIDAGSRKDTAGDKLSENMRVSLYDCHCHTVMFGCSHNDEYAQVVEEISQDNEVADHLVLLEGIPFEASLSTLQQKFKTVRFDNIFRSAKPVAPKTLPAVVLPTLSRVESNKTSSNNSASSTPHLNWATVTAQAHANPATGSQSSNSTPATVTAKSTGKVTPTSNTANKTSTKSISTNRLGERIDRTDETIANYEIQKVKKLKLCNTFYLQGQKCTSSHCTHRHDYPISNWERKCLREVARMTPCYYRTDCEDPDCIYGHRCPQSKPNESGCYYGDECRFYGWGHGIDTRIVKTVRV